MIDENSLGERHSASFVGIFFFKYLCRFVSKWIFICLFQQLIRKEITIIIEDDEMFQT